MKTQTNLLNLLLVLALFGFVSCDDSDTTEEIVPLVEETAFDVPADPDMSGGFTYFSFENGIVDSTQANSDAWDLAFSGTTILTNGGASGPGQGAGLVVAGIFENVSEVQENELKIDAEGSPAIQGSDSQVENVPGWYTYTGEAPSGPQRAIIAVPGRVIIVKTAKGNFAKMEILSYYEGNPDTTTDEFANFATRPASRHYTFRYVVQKNGGNVF